ncbi:MAG: hypothetical protein HZA67_05225 [Rhodospirillales bacterium]|jgi:hypothetical protein|nr:hypothetical protein [Rhodospirillales bacterium]MDK9721267.1 hypothetical protein [Rhodospirillales bacterium]
MSEPSQPTDINELLERDAGLAASLVAAARRLLAEGRFLDLGALEARISQLCGRISGMPQEEGQRFATFLGELNEELDALAREIEARCTLLALERTGGSGTAAYARRD